MTADLQFLADATRCPSCSAVLPAERNACAACGLRLTGVLAGRLWQVSVQAAELLETRRLIIEQMRHEPAMAPAAATPPTGPAPFAPRPPAPVAPAKPKPEWSRRRVQNLLLALGVGLLTVAAIIFLAVSWDRLGVGGRSAVMAGVTAMAGFAATRTHRRSLGSTAEWLSLLTVGLAILDCAGARAADLAGLASTRLPSTGPARWPPWRSSPACSRSSCRPAACGSLLRRSACCRCPCCPSTSRPTPTARSPSPRPASPCRPSPPWRWPPLGPSGRAPGCPHVVAVGGAVSLVVASMYAGGAAYAEAGSLVVGTALLLVLAAILAVAGTVLADRPAYAVVVPVLDGGAAVLLVTAAWAPAYDVVPDRWLPAVLAATGAALLAATLLVPAARRKVPAVVALGAALLPALAAAEPVARTLDHMLGALHRPWQLAAADVAVVSDRPAVVELLAGGVALIIAARVLRFRHLAAVAVPVLAGAAVLTPPAFGAGYPLTLGVAVAIAAALLVAGALIQNRGRVILGWTALGSGAVLLALATVWSFANDVATLLTLPAAALALLAGAAATRGAEALRAWRVALVTSALLLGVAEAAALARHDGAGWEAVWSLALGLLAMVAAAVAITITLRTSAQDSFWAPLHSLAVAVATAAVVAEPPPSLPGTTSRRPAAGWRRPAPRARCSPSLRSRSTFPGRSVAWCRSWQLLPPYPPWRLPRWTPSGSGSPCSPSGSASPWSPRRRSGTASAGWPA